MSKLVAKLKADHVELVKTLEEAKKLGVTPAGLAKLQSAKAALLAHLKHEDQELYPKLREAAKSDPALHSLLEVFASEMEGITAFVVEFFGKYENATGKVDFAKDFGKLLGSLGNRIRREETLLYEAYQRVESRNAAKDKKSA